MSKRGGKLPPPAYPVAQSQRRSTQDRESRRSDRETLHTPPRRSEKKDLLTTPLPAFGGGRAAFCGWNFSIHDINEDRLSDLTTVVQSVSGNKQLVREASGSFSARFALEADARLIHQVLTLLQMNVGSLGLVRRTDLPLTDEQVLPALRIAPFIKRKFPSAACFVDGQRRTVTIRADTAEVLKAANTYFFEELSAVKVVDKKVDISPAVAGFLHEKRLDSLQEQAGSFGVALHWSKSAVVSSSPIPGVDEKKHFSLPPTGLVLKGTASKISELVNTIDVMVEDIDKEEFVLPIMSEQHARVLPREVRRVLEEMDDPNVLAYQRVVLKKSTGTKALAVTIVGPREVSSHMKEMMRRAQQLPSSITTRVDTTSFDRKEVAKLDSALFNPTSAAAHPTMQIGRFQKSYRVHVMLDKDNATVSVTGLPEAQDEAISAMKIFCQGQKPVSANITEDDGVLRDLLSSSSAFTRLATDLAQASKVTIRFSKGKNLVCSLKGSEARVNDVKRAILKGIEAVRTSVLRATVAVPAWMLSVLNERSAALTAGENKAICWSKEKKEENDDHPAAFPAVSIAPTNLASFQYDSCTVEVWRGDVIASDYFKADALVNPANRELKHIGGLARQVATYCGNEWNRRCLDSVATEGPLDVGSARMTEAAGLLRQRFQHIINTVGPKWENGQKGEPSLLQSAVQSALQEALDAGLTSITLPAISTGVYGRAEFNAYSARLILAAVVQFLLVNQSSCSLQRIILVDISDNVSGELKRAVEEWVRDKDMKKLAQYDNPVIQANKFKEEFQWMWQENDKSWKPFDPDQNRQLEIARVELEAARKRGDPGRHTILLTGDYQMQKNKFDYEVNLDDMFEINTHYRQNKRPIKKVAIAARDDSKTPAFGAAAAAVASDDGDAQPYSENVPLMDVYVGSTDQAILLSLRDQVLNEVKTARGTIDIDLKRILPMQVQDEFKSRKSRLRLLAEARAVAVEVHVSVVWPEGGAGDVLRLVGCKGSARLTTAKTNVIASLLSLIPMPDPVPGPVMLDEATVNIIDLPRDHPEFKLALDRVAETLPNAKLVKVQLVQNKWHWRKYTDKRAQIMSRLSDQERVAGEVLLFHGTGTFKPSDLIRDEEGFDTRFAQAGLWGTGTYFASNASYSSSYAHQTTTEVEGKSKQVRQFFLAQVTVGAPKLLASDRSLKMPPTRAGTFERYDSVSCDHAGSRNYIVYTNDRAYAKYLITFYLD